MLGRDHLLSSRIDPLGYRRAPAFDAATMVAHHPGRQILSGEGNRVVTSKMPCLICNGPTSLKDRGGDWNRGRSAFVRKRTCDLDPDHQFETLEQYATEEILNRAEVVTKSGTGPFETDVVAKDIDYTVSKSLSEAQRLALVQRLFKRIVNTHYRSGRVVDLPTGVTLRITRAEIRDAVAATIATEAAKMRKSASRRDHRRAHMLYGFARGSEGSALRDARAVLDWLSQNYGATVDPEKRGYGVRRHNDAVREDRWLPLRSDAAPEPTHVVFLKHITTGPLPEKATDREAGPVDESAQRVTMIHTRVPYDRARLESSIRHALAGTHDHTRVTRYVLQWVLWSLGGQTVVRQADLASQVAQCLRRVNEVAYLRWAIQVRDLDVKDVWNEALGLLSWPSPKLVFQPVRDHDPQRTHHVMPLPDHEAIADLPTWDNPTP